MSSSAAAHARRIDQDLVDRTRGLAGMFGRTPAVRLPDERFDLMAKLEYCNPHGSLKDRPAYWILRCAAERGEIGPNTTVVESSSGNFARSMASFCKMLGLSFVPVIDPNTNALTERQLRLLCARVEKVTEPDASGGFLGTRLARVAELRNELPDVYWPDQYANPDAVAAHDLLTGAELCGQSDRLDYVFVGVGTGATIAGLSQRVTREFPSARVVAVDSVGSATFGGPTQRRHIPGIGSSIVPPFVALARIDDVVLVPERDAVAGCRELFTRHGILAGGSTGSVYTAISRYFPRSSTNRPAVAFLCADSGAPYIDTVYDRQWRPVPAPTTAKG